MVKPIYESPWWKRRRYGYVFDYVPRQADGDGFDYVSRQGDLMVCGEGLEEFFDIGKAKRIKVVIFLECPGENAVKITLGRGLGIRFDARSPSIYAAALHILVGLFCYEHDTKTLYAKVYIDA